MPLQISWGKRGFFRVFFYTTEDPRFLEISCVFVVVVVVVVVVAAVVVAVVVVVVVLSILDLHYRLILHDPFHLVNVLQHHFLHVK